MVKRLFLKRRGIFLAPLVTSLGFPCLHLTSDDLELFAKTQSHCRAFLPA